MVNNPNAAKAINDETDVAVGQAWSLHYHGEHGNAVQMFQQLVTNNPEHIDANFGYALSLKGAGKREQAAEAFRKTKALIDQELPKDAVVTEDNQRMLMLKRICDQHISTLQ
jgi:Flp pilus assembly protein TadD